MNRAVGKTVPAGAKYDENGEVNVVRDRGDEGTPACPPNLTGGNLPGQRVKTGSGRKIQSVGGDQFSFPHMP